jgi:hypothetical protein
VKVDQTLTVSRALYTSTSPPRPPPAVPAGWYKASVVWLFTLSAAAGARALLAALFLDGPLPGEEAVEHEVAFALAWRLVPFWLSRWEREWGAESASLLYAAPHVAAELLLLQPLLHVRRLSAPSLHRCCCCSRCSAYAAASPRLGQWRAASRVACLPEPVAPD